MAQSLYFVSFLSKVMDSISQTAGGTWGSNKLNIPTEQLPHSVVPFSWETTFYWHSFGCHSISDATVAVVGLIGHPVDICEPLNMSSILLQAAKNNTTVIDGIHSWTQTLWTSDTKHSNSGPPNLCLCGLKLCNLAACRVIFHIELRFPIPLCKYPATAICRGGSP